MVIYRTRPRFMSLRWLLLAAALLMVVGAGLGLIFGAFGALNEKLDIFAHFRGHFALVALAAAILAALSGGRRLALAAVCVGAVAVMALWPVWRSQAEAAPSCGVETLRVATANLYYDNLEPAAAAAALEALEVDVLATEETPYTFWAAATKLRARMPYQVAERFTRTGDYGVVLWSRRPIERGATRIGGNSPALAYGAITVGGREIGLAGAHASWPRRGRQTRQIVGLKQALAPLPADRIVMGDFNATPWSAAMARAEEAAGVRMASGLRLTWRGVYPNPLRRLRSWSPQFRRRIPALLGHQIDHVMVSPGIGVRDIATATIPGSDHRAVVATLEIPKACSS